MTSKIFRFTNSLNLDIYTYFHLRIIETVDKVEEQKRGDQEQKDLEEIYEDLFTFHRLYLHRLVVRLRL